MEARMERRAFFGRLAAAFGLVALPAPAAQPVRQVLVQSSPLAGFQHRVVS
jgi:hypothetical protein